jgi:hypothetical protein
LEFSQLVGFPVVLKVICDMLEVIQHGVVAQGYSKLLIKQSDVLNTGLPGEFSDL